ncbi:MAG: hypothetical protein LRZ88_02915 [Candidatus Cloacimonetes bacterium]|nr:hypothetical protein [Candidatus Cloacimonadota bacterium]
MRRVYLYLLMLLPALLLAQACSRRSPAILSDDEYEYSEEASYGLGASVGTVTHNGLSYSQVRLFPELSIGKFGFGLDLDLLIDANGKVYKENWNNWEDYVNKIFFIRYANRRDPYYFKVGCIPDYTLGHGLIFDHYSNMLRYPTTKNVGGYMGINAPFFGAGFEVFTHNIHTNEILAARAHFNPLDSLDVPILEKIKLGVNLGMDRNKYGKYPDKDGDNIPDVYDKFPNDPYSWLDTDDNGIPG